MTGAGGSGLGAAAQRVARSRWFVGIWLGYRLLSGWLVALPVASLLGAVLAGYPEGDAVLFEPGGELLVETVRSHGAALRAALGTSLRLAALCSLLGLWPLGMLLESWRSPRLRFSLIAARALARWPALAAISGVALLGQALVIAAGATLMPVARALGASLGELGADLVGLVPLAVGGLAAGCLAIALDLGRIGLVRGARGLPSVRRALEAAASAPRGFVLAYAMAKAVTLTAMAAAAATAAAAGVHQPDGWRVAVVATAHLAVVTVDVLGRAAWLAWATLRLEACLTPSRRSPGGKAAGTAAPVDPSSCPGA